MSKKREYIINNLKASEEIADAVMEYCRTIGSDKYAIWMAREVKKNSDNLNYEKFRLIIDWAQSTSPNILNLNFEDAYQISVDWHEELIKNSTKEFANSLDIDQDRILYRCSDKKHFFYRLKPTDLKMEGKLMGHCIGGQNYVTRLQKKEIDVISLRDDKNYPHVTIEIERKTGISRQISGKGNRSPVDLYEKMITEYALFMSDDEDAQVLISLMNL